jgi:hypothetical protein
MSGMIMPGAYSSEAVNVVVFSMDFSSVYPVLSSVRGVHSTGRCDLPVSD